jgi:vacuolar-type H+-ATPase subunit F/Vma7
MTRQVAAPKNSGAAEVVDMTEKYDVYAVGSKYFTLGFRGAGCATIECNNSQELFSHLKQGIYIVEPSLAMPVYGKIERINSTNPKITIIVYGTESLQLHIQRATGMVQNKGVA